jgi:hypothetical protein
MVMAVRRIDKNSQISDGFQFQSAQQVSSAQPTSRELHYYKRYDKLVGAPVSLKSVHPITLLTSMKQLQNLRKDLHRI